MIKKPLKFKKNNFNKQIYHFLNFFFRLTEMMRPGNAFEALNNQPLLKHLLIDDNAASSKHSSRDVAFSFKSVV
jgi:hypothetical protein